jgi:phosphohistidine phosphatase SixA
MKKLIIARHGSYDEKRNLDGKGIHEMQKLAVAIVSEVAGMKAAILASAAPRALQSAAILSAHIEVPYESTPVLWSCEGHSYNPERAMHLIEEKENSADCLILVTHLEFVKFFPPDFGMERLNTPLRGSEIPKGSAWVIDCMSKDQKVINSR